MMHLLRIILLLVVALCSPLALGMCFKGGIKGNYGPPNKRIINMEVICGYMAGEYRNGEFKQMCMTDDAGKRWDFKLKVCFLSLSLSRVPVAEYE